MHYIYIYLYIQHENAQERAGQKGNDEPNCATMSLIIRLQFYTQYGAIWRICT